jgi:hypothetical protein
VSRREVSNPDGSKAVFVGFDMALAPVPDRKYVADAANFIQADDSAKLLFGQRKISGSSLRSLLVVHLSNESLTQLADISRQISVQLSAYLKERKLDTISFLDINEEPAQTIGFSANIIGCAYAGTEATMDFFHASAFAMHQALTNASAPQLGLDPVVRVNIPSRLLSTILAAVEAAVKATDGSKGAGT